MTSVEQPSATFRPSALLGGSLSPGAGHLPFASDLIAALKPSMIVELGVSHGDTYFGLCQLVSESDFACLVCGIDTWPGNKESAAQGNGSESSGSSVYDTVSRHNNLHYQSFSHLVRKGFDEALAEFENESIGLLHIDGVQPYEALKRVCDAWLEKVQPGGVILLGNITARGGDAAASRVWNEVKSGFPHFEFRHNHGLGVLGKSASAAAQVPFLTDLFHAEPDEQDRLRRYYSHCASRLELAAPNPHVGQSLFRVFRSQDDKYETMPALSHAVNPGAWISLHLDLPEGTGDRALRLDVANRPAVVDIAILSLRKADGHTVWSWNPKSAGDQLRVEGTATRLPEPEFFRVLALGSAAQVFLPELADEDCQQPLELEIRLRVDLELTAVKELAQKELSQKELTLNKFADAASASPAVLEAAVAKAKADSAKYLAHSRIEYDAKIRQITSDSEARLETLRAELEALRSEMETLKAGHRDSMEIQVAELEAERGNHQVTRLEKENLLAQQPRMLQEISIAQGNVEELKAEVERLSGELATAEFELMELRKLNARMAAALEQERSARIQMQESGSWQLTKPIRAVGDLFGPRKKY